MSERRRPNIADLVAEGRLRLQEPDLDALIETLDLAVRDVEAAAANESRFAPWAETMLYEAGLRTSASYQRRRSGATSSATRHQLPPQEQLPRSASSSSTEWTGMARLTRVDVTLWPPCGATGAANVKQATLLQPERRATPSARIPRGSLCAQTARLGSCAKGGSHLGLGPGCRRRP